MIAGVDDTFPMRHWDKLLPHFANPMQFHQYPHTNMSEELLTTITWS